METISELLATIDQSLGNVPALVNWIAAVCTIGGAAYVAGRWIFRRWIFGFLARRFRNAAEGSIRATLDQQRDAFAIYQLLPMPTSILFAHGLAVAQPFGRAVLAGLVALLIAVAVPSPPGLTELLLTVFIVVFVIYSLLALEMLKSTREALDAAHDMPASTQKTAAMVLKLQLVCGQPLSAFDFTDTGLSVRDGGLYILPDFAPPQDHPESRQDSQPEPPGGSGAG